MTAMAPMSSAIASASRKSFAPTEILLPSSDSTPAPNRFTAGPNGESDVDERRDDHATHGCKSRQGCLPRIPQLAFYQLALDLHADDEEEDRHEAIVNEFLEALTEMECTEIDVEVNVPEGKVRLGPRAVRPDDGGDRGKQQHDTTCRLDLHEAQRWAYESTGDITVRVQPRPMEPLVFCHGESS